MVAFSKMVKQLTCNYHASEKPDTGWQRSYKGESESSVKRCKIDVEMSNHSVAGAFGVLDHR